MKNGVCPDSIGAGSLRASFFLAKKKVRGMVERFFSTPASGLPLCRDGNSAKRVVVDQLGNGRGIAAE